MDLEEQIAEAMIRATTAPAEAGDDAVKHAREDDGHLWHIARVQARAAIGVMRGRKGKADHSLGGVKTNRMDGDNLAITLCTSFDNPEQDNDDETGWTPDALAGCEEVLAAIRTHYQSIF